MRRPVYDGVAIETPFDLALAGLAGEPRSWLPDPAEPHPRGTVVQMHATGMLASAGVAALVDVGELEPDPPGLAVRPVAWRALNADRMFPRFVGELELSATSHRTSRLTLVGGYQPPISVVGDAADRLLGHHVAEAVIRNFLERVAASITQLAEVARPRY